MATNSTTSKHESNDQYVNLQAPPPTPSNHHDHHDSFSTSQLSFILNQILIPPLKPILSSPSPTISFLLPNHKTKLSLLSTVTRHPFFHLKDLHIHIPSHLPPSSLLESKSLLPSKNFSSLCFNKDEDDDDEDDDEAKTLQVLEPTSIDPNTLPSLHEFTQCLQKVAMEVLEMLFDGMLDHEGAPTPRFLIWISKSKEKKDELEMEMEMERRRNIKCYPYVMCMQYEMRGRGRTSWVVGDSGELVSIPFRADSLLVTLGDIAQVWSNGRFKKARGVPFQSSSSNHDYNGDQSFISLTFMVTLPLESTISPLLPLKIKDDNNNGGEEEDANDDGWKRLTPFLMVDYAWKVYHERFIEKDPLIQYRIPEV